MNFFILIEEREYGPYSKEELNEFLKTQRANINTPTREESSDTYRNLYEILKVRTSESTSIPPKKINIPYNLRNIISSKILLIVAPILFLIIFLISSFSEIKRSIKQIEANVKPLLIATNKNSDNQNYQEKVKSNSELIEKINNEILLLKTSISKFDESNSSIIKGMDSMIAALFNRFDEKMNEKSTRMDDLYSKNSVDLETILKLKEEIESQLKFAKQIEPNFKEILNNQKALDQKVDSEILKMNKSISELESKFDLVVTHLKALHKTANN